MGWCWVIGMNTELFQSIAFEPGVGTRRAAVMERLPIRTPAEMLFYFPRDYEDFSNFTDVQHLVPDEQQTICARVLHVYSRFASRGTITTVDVEDGTYGLAQMVFFNQRFRETQFVRGQIYLIHGRPKQVRKRWQFAHPVVRLLPEEEVRQINEQTVPGNRIGGLSEENVLDKIPTAASFFGWQPVYRLTEGLQGWELRRIARNMLEKYADEVEESLPEAFRERHRLLGVAEALRKIHFPATKEEMEAARRRFVFQEFLLLQLALGVRRNQQRVHFRAPILEATPEIDQRIRALFPYSLTDGQLRAIGEITQDTVSGKPMNRLLQGDVGCGKTTVAVYAILLAVAHGFQAVVMAPTEVLAQQHYRTLTRMLAHSSVRPIPLWGGLRRSERQETLQKIASGEAKIVVGTHALLQEDVQFAQLGMVVIDEQHKFGVQQRATLRKSGESPHYLVMTATPIPRTVTMTLFGDLDITTIQELPPGRQKIHTYLANQEQREGWWRFFREKIEGGSQGYVVVPHIGALESSEVQEMEGEEEEEGGIATLAQIFQELSTGALRGLRLGMLHGRMSSEEKENVMRDFRTGEIQVLVSTSVIEVGVDVPNATLMTIESAERFGLAQLHQLRGRISRGKKPGYCCVFPSHEKEETLKRLKIFTSSTNGFDLAEVDFSLRGPGNLFGTAQHGLPPFHLADMLRDREILEESRRVSAELLDNDPGLAQPEFRRIRLQMLKRYGKALELGDVG
ncbi:MAG: ATP-dependent DNA helicase RecG [Planctomycetia bacterium]|nr:ATP-dependent DNA helicase RecG [Planctomycetia bacterium]